MESDRWLGIELRHLTALEAVSREGSFGRAAKSLGYTQSAISQQIAALERIVDARLVERPGGPRPVSLTEAGELLLRHAEAIVARLAAAQADLGALAEGEGGVLRVGIYQSVGQRILPELMRRYAAAWPRVEIALTESASDAELLGLVERGELDLTFADLPRVEIALTESASDAELLGLVERGELDLTFADLPLVDGPFEAVELLRDPYVLIVPAGSPLAERDTTPSRRDIAALDLIGYRSCRSTVRIEGALRERLHFVFRSDHNGTVQGLVGAGVGAALVPRLTLEPHDETIVELDLGPKVPPRLIAVAWHRDRYRTPAAEAFVETALGVCGELQGETEPVAA